MSVLVWTASLARVAADPDLDFLFREEIGHDLLGYPPPSIDLARRQLTSTRRTTSTCLASFDPDVLARELTIPDLGTLTVEAWTPPVLGHAAGHADQALDVLRDRGAITDTRAAVLTGLREMRLEDRPEPDAAPGWVVVQVETASLCGTDAHQYDGRVDKPFDCQRKKLIGLWSDGCLTARITVPVVNLIPRQDGVSAY